MTFLKNLSRIIFLLNFVKLCSELKRFCAKKRELSLFMVSSLQRLLIFLFPKVVIV